MKNIVIQKLKYVHEYHDRLGKIASLLALARSKINPAARRTGFAQIYSGLQCRPDTAKDHPRPIEAVAELAGYEVARLVNGREGKIVVELTPTREPAS